MIQIIQSLMVISLICNLSCTSQEREVPKQTPLLSSLTGKSGSAILRCGSKSSEVNWIVHNENADTKRFAIILGGSPVTKYLSDSSRGAQTLVASMIDKDLKVFELRYPLPKGFYDACHGEGMEHIVRHAGEIYDLSQKVLGFDPNNSQHKIVGAGYSIGAIKLQAMAFILGKRIDQVALTGVLMGDVTKGCRHYLNDIKDGYSWYFFHNYAALVTKDLQGCHSDKELNEKLNFENLPHAREWSLGLFEGTALNLSSKNAPANPDQAQYIWQKRKDLNAPVELKTYEGCGHELFECTQGKVVKDMVDFLTK